MYTDSTTNVLSYLKILRLLRHPTSPSSQQPPKHPLPKFLPTDAPPHLQPTPNNFAANGCFPLRSTNKRFLKTEMNKGLRRKTARVDKETAVGVGGGFGGGGWEVEWGLVLGGGGRGETAF